MNISTNKKNRKHVVENSYGDVKFEYAVPFFGEKKAKSLTIKSGKTKLSLNGRQVRLLRLALDKADWIAG